MKIPYFRIKFKEEEKKTLLKVLERGFLSFGKECLDLEKNLEKLTGYKIVFVSSATFGLHIIYRALEIGKYDEVLVPSFTFTATVEPLLHLGATPVFVDVISEKYPVIDLKDAERKISKKTKALVFMHYAGFVIDMKPYLEFCKEKGIYLIEDAAHAFPVKREGKYAGTFGIAGVYSFYGNKNLHLGEGGAILTNDENLYKKLKTLRNHGIEVLSFEKEELDSEYDIRFPGFNARPTELQGALANSLLKRINEIQKKRKEIYIRIRKEIEGKLFFPYEIETPSSYHINPVFTKNEKERRDLLQYLKYKGIQVSHHYPPVHLFSYIKERYGILKLEIAEDLSKREITLPLYPDMEEEEIEYLIEVLKEF